MKDKNLHIIQEVVANTCRFLLAASFIFSGFVKAVDPLGFQYKIQDYLTAFGMASWFPSFFPLLGGIILSAVEFFIGISLFFATRRTLATSLALMLMIFMTPLTLYLAIFDPVSDCGCFGDAWVLTNWETFGKNIVLLFAAMMAFRHRRMLVRFISVKMEWLVSLYTLFFVFTLSFYCLDRLPVLDFRPYKIGKNILEGMTMPEGAKPSVYESIFILEKNGEKKEFTLDNYPDSTWTFVDTRTILKEKGYEVYAACANTGGFSPEQLKKNEENAYKLGAVKYVTLDVTQEYYEKSLKYMVFGNVLRNGTYPISVSSERIFQALAIARYANEIGADAIAHGSTGAGNDQIRFDMTFLVMAPGVEIITLTRDMALSRQEEIDYLNQHGFAADFTKLKYSYNVGLWGTSICGGEILDSAQGLPESAYLKHCTKEGSEQLRLTFEKGELKAVNDETFDDPIKAIQKVEEIGAAYGIGRDMHVGDTIIGIKGRVGFEAAAPMLIIGAHKFLEKYTLSKWQQYWKDQVANWYGMFLHESQYLEPVMRDIEAMLESSQRNVNGTAILELHPLCFSTVGVESKDDLVKNKFGEYGEMQKGWTAEDAKGFIKVTSTALRAYYSNHKDEKI